jgi:signal transduction histidine kinase/response regulator RpfG family c-di-GMP phosphodiesterase
MTQSMLEKVNILLVDDRPEKLLALEAVLEELGQNIVRAYSGREALRALLNEDFAVILLDVNMPGMDGFETAALIRQRKSTEQIPIIFITAFGDEMEVRGYSLGAVDFIQTPVVPEVLKTKVGVFVDLYKKTEQVVRQAEWLRQRANQLHKLTAASLAINSALSMEQMLRVVTDTARDVIGTHRAVSTVVLNDDWVKTTTVVSASERFPEGSELPFPRTDDAGGEGLHQIVCRMNKPMRLTQREMEQHPAFPVSAGTGGAPREPIRGWLAAPLSGRDGRNLGLIELTDKIEGDFTGDDEAVVVQLAQMTSIAVENTFYAQERETNRIKDEFLSMLSHELRTPLNAILGWTHLLRSGRLDEETAYGVEVIERNARAQSKLIEDMLDVSRITTGKLRITTRPMTLRSVVRAAVDAVRPVAENKKIALDCRSANDVDDRLIGDPDRLQQVVWNLLSNAVKFTPERGRVTVAVDRVNAMLRVRVTDTGQGISPKFLPYVFDRFRQADSTSTRHHGGLGIGLTIVRRIVELHGGSVSAESAGEGMGSTFTVTLPAAADDVASAGQNGDAQPQTATPAVAASPESIEREPLTGDLAGAHVLLVDDQADAREVVGHMLRRAGARVTTTASVGEALAAFHRERPDVVLSDIAMPEEDGFDLIRILRELPEDRGGDVPCVALTAYAREEDRNRALAEGFQAHLVKPIDPNELISVVAHLAAEVIRSSKSARPTLRLA